MRQGGTLFEAEWMEMMRGVAIIAIVLHHWLLFIPHKSTISFFFSTAKIIETVGGTAVHIFFILSGCGLTISLLKTKNLLWKKWFKRRFERIVAPYWIFIPLTFILALLSNLIFPDFVQKTFSLHSLFAYLTFTRNFYSPSWPLNPTMWFMPVIIGLYILFPFLVKVLQKYGPKCLFVISIIVTYVSITLCELFGYSVKHQSALFLFYVVEFSFGILIGHSLFFHKDTLNRFLKLNMFCLGAGIYTLSWAIQKYWQLGCDYNDFLTSVGIFLLMINICSWIFHVSPNKSVFVLNKFSKASYIMYLIHGPLILFIAKPLLMRTQVLPLNSITTMILSLTFCVFIFALALLIQPAVNLLTTRFFKKA